MEEIAQQFREELQEIVDRYKTRLSVPRIMHVAQDVFHKTLSVRYHPELHSKEINGLKIPAELLEDPDNELKKVMQGEFPRDEAMEGMAEEYAKTNRHYEIAKRENGADYAKEVSNVTIEQTYLDGQKDLNDIHSKNLTRAEAIIKDLLKCLPKENIEGVYEVTEAAEQFLIGMDYTKPTKPGDEPNAFRGPNAICRQGPDGCCATYKGGWDKCKGCVMYYGENRCID